MSHAIYDEQWQEAMDKLQLLINIETIETPEEIANKLKQQTIIKNTTNEENANETPIKTLDMTPDQAFERYTLLYLRYLEIFREVEECYDQIVHPQKRRDIKVIVDCCIIRIFELKKLIIKHSSMPGLWSYVSLDKYAYILQKNLSSIELEPIVPKYFLEEELVNEERLQMLENIFMQMKEKVKIPKQFGSVSISRQYLIMDNKKLNLSINEAVEIIQKIERARQAIQRVNILKKLKKDEILCKLRDKKIQIMDETTAAIVIQRNFRGHYIRKHMAIQNSNELAFLSMEHPFIDSRLQAIADTTTAEMDTSVNTTVNVDAYDESSGNCEIKMYDDITFMKQLYFKDLSLPNNIQSNMIANSYQCFVGKNDATFLKQHEIREKRINLRIENEVEFERSIGDIRHNLLLEEGPTIRENARQQRFEWSIKQRELKGMYPSNFDLFYKEKEALLNGISLDDEKKNDVNEDKGKKKKKKDGKKKKNNAKQKKNKGKGKKKSADEESKTDDPFVHVQTPEIVQTTLKQAIEKCYKWRSVDESQNFAQKHSIDIVKEELMPSVVKQIESEVDVQLLETLDNLRMQLGISTGGKGTKGKKSNKKKKVKKGNKKKRT